jgi:hypothetical protein
VDECKPLILGQNAVHAAFAGLTGATVGLCNGHYGRTAALLPVSPHMALHSFSPWNTQGIPTVTSTQFWWGKQMGIWIYLIS